MDETQKHYAELKKPDTEINYGLISFTWSSKIGELNLFGNIRLIIAYGDLILTRCRHGGTFWSDINVLHLTGDPVHKFVHTERKLSRR